MNGDALLQLSRLSVLHRRTVDVLSKLPVKIGEVIEARLKADFHDAGIPVTQQGCCMNDPHVVNKL